MRHASLSPLASSVCFPSGQIGRLPGGAVHRVRAALLRRLPPRAAPQVPPAGAGVHSATEVLRRLSSKHTVEVRQK